MLKYEFVGLDENIVELYLRGLRPSISYMVQLQFILVFARCTNAILEVGEMTRTLGPPQRGWTN